MFTGLSGGGGFGLFGEMMKGKPLSDCFSICLLPAASYLAETDIFEAFISDGNKLRRNISSCPWNLEPLSMNVEKKMKLCPLIDLLTVHLKNEKTWNDRNILAAH